VRVNGDASAIVSYRVVCGEQRTLSLEDAKAQLGVVSRINWLEAATYGSVGTGYLFVHESAPYDVLAIGPTTGQPIFEFAGTNPTTAEVVDEWSASTDLDGACNGSSGLAYVALGPWEVSDPGSLVVELLYSKGVFAAVEAANGGHNSITLVRAPLSNLEFFVIIGTTPRV
jgi:hypothetical protein